MCASLTSAAQNAVPIPDVPGIKMGTNRLDFPGSREQFDTLLNRLLHSEEPIKILHMGGSHVQAGIFPNRLREHFDAGRGMLFPWKAIHTNAPADYSLIPSGIWDKSRCIEQSPTERLGMSGVAAITSDSLASLRLELSSKYAFSQLRIVGEAEGAAEPYIVCDNGDTIMAERDDADFLFSLDKPSSTCTIAFSGLGDSSSFILRGIWPECKQRIFYSESGVNGASVPSWLRCELLSEELSRICPPDLVIFGIGINDANVPPSSFDIEAFKASYRNLMDELRKANPNVCFLFITNNDCWLRSGRQRRTCNRNTQKVEQAMMELARECNGAVWNQFRIMGGYGSSNRWVNAHLMNRDHIHFLRPGYELLGDLLYNAMQQSSTISREGRN
jgi:lysophospholipase L1-like esterase